MSYCASQVIESKPYHSPPQLTSHQAEDKPQTRTKEDEVNKQILSSPVKSVENEDLQTDPASSIHIAAPIMPTELESTEPDQSPNKSGQQNIPQKEDVIMEEGNAGATVKNSNPVGTPEIQVSIPENAVSIDFPKQKLDSPDIPVPMEIAQNVGEVNEVTDTGYLKVPEESEPLEETHVEIQAINPPEFISSGLNQKTSPQSAKRKTISGKEAPTSLLRKRLKKAPSETNSEANDTNKVQTVSPTPETTQTGSKSLSFPSKSGTPKEDLGKKQDTNSSERKANAEEKAKANTQSPGKIAGPVQSNNHVSSHPQPKGSVEAPILANPGTSPQNGSQSSQAPKRTAGGFLANLLGKPSKIFILLQMPSPTFCALSCFLCARLHPEIGHKPTQCENCDIANLLSMFLTNDLIRDCSNFCQSWHRQFRMRGFHQCFPYFGQ